MDLDDLEVRRELPAVSSRDDFDAHTQLVYGLCMETKAISVETDACELLAKEKKHHTESFSRVIRRLFAERFLDLVALDACVSPFRVVQMSRMIAWRTALTYGATLVGREKAFARVPRLDYLAFKPVASIPVRIP